MAENVNHPAHYNSGNFECIDVMIDVFGKEETAAFCKLNAFKYLWRSENKNGIEDIKKAVWYLNKLIEISKNSDEENEKYAGCIGCKFEEKRLNEFPCCTCCNFDCYKDKKKENENS